MDKVCIITPTYNADAYILDTIRSVRAQTYINWEMIIVDDGSIDNTIDLVKDQLYLDSRIILIQSSKNQGPAYARNKGIMASNSRYIAFLDSDDIWHPNKLERQIAFMKKMDASFTFTSYRIMKENGQTTDKVMNVSEQVTYASLLKNTSIGTLTVMLDKQKLGAVQMPLQSNCSEDYGMWLNILSKGEVAYGLNEVLAFYRKRHKSLSSNKWISARKTWNTYRKVLEISIPSSCWCFLHYGYNAWRKHS
ncbi:glycosyltransferase family 2 protein [Halobacillus sp. KGW1]|uniref:glycosyltransferase family 2 protein n=1 Tax=Halobacillus sp. KGW1 TaxID=1793726 RepID=UPI0007847DA1|nr:glycosyltransferase family 2 protein [Halobacillus sp. KGW1]